MSVKSAFSVTKALAAAAAFVPQAIGGAWLIMLLMLAVTVGGHLFLIAHQTPNAWHGVIIGAAFVLKLMALGALYRMALFGRQAKAEGLGIGGLQFGRPEVRLLLANLVVFIFICLIIVILLAVFAMALSMGGYDASLAGVEAIFAHPSGSGWIYVCYAVASWLFLIFVGLKFTLMPAANIAERRLVTLNALGLSSGNVGKLFIGLIVIMLPFAAACFAVMKAFARDIRLAHLLPHAYGAYEVHFVVHAVIQVIAVCLVLPLSAGFLASAYSQIVAFRVK